MSNDSTGSYLDARSPAYASPAEQYRAAKAQEAENKSLLEMGKDVVDTATDVAGDVALGVVEAPRQVLGGFLDATAEMAEFMNDIIPLQDNPEYLTTDEPRTVTGQGIRSISQFLTGFLPAMKGAKALQLGKASPYVAGAVADAAAFDAHEARLSNLIQEFPALENPVTEYLAADADDTEAEGRMKNAIEGLALGGMTDAVFRGVKALRGWRLDKRAAEAVEQVDDVTTLPDVREPDIEGEFIPFKETMGNPEGRMFSQGSTKAGDERALNINLSRLDTTEDVEKLIEGVGKSDAVRINEARRQVITHSETERLADELGMSVDDLLARRQGQAFNAEEAVAARKILVSSGENLMDLAESARTGGDLEMAQFRRAFAQHEAIQAQVSGMTAEAGRALNSFRILASAGREQQRAIKEALEAGGGIEQTREMAEMISKLDGTHQINAAVKQSLAKRAMGITYEAWINALLSSPATHAVNVIGNSITAGWNVGERKVASWISQALGDGAIPEGEATATAYGLVKGAKDGLKLAWDAFKTGDPSDVVQKIEQSQYRALSAETLELTGVPGRMADFVGHNIVRVPGRLLTAGDELFKTMGYRMELHAQAFRQAASEGLDGDAMAARINQIIENPPENLRLDAVDASRYITFTKPLGPSGEAFQRWVSRTPGMRLIVPFIRTPTNIMKYVGERTPVSWAFKGIREEIKAGGARRDLALAKMATGSMVMAAAADWSMSGDITGKGPTNPDMRQALYATGWQPYSIKIGDEYVAYNRLDPVGATIGIAADMAEILGQTTEASALDLATAGVVGVAQNVTSKTYLSGLSEFFDVMSSTSADPTKNMAKFTRWRDRMIGTVVPSGVAQLERTMDPTLRATEDYIDVIKSRIPGYSDELPPRRNIFGEPIVLSGGIGPDIMSPIYTSTDENDPVADEIVKQQTLLRMPMKNINGVELDIDQYDKYIQFYSGKNNEFVDVPLKTQLKLLFASPEYQMASDGQEGGKSVMIRATFENYRNAAKAMMLQTSPELQVSIMKAKVKRQSKLIGPGL